MLFEGWEFDGTTDTARRSGYYAIQGANLAGYTHIDVCMSTPWLKIKTRVYKGGKAGCKIREWVSDGNKTISRLSRYTLSILLQMSASPCHQSSVCSQHSWWVPRPIKSKDELFQLSILPKFCQEAVQKIMNVKKYFLVRSDQTVLLTATLFSCATKILDERPWPPQNI